MLNVTQQVSGGVTIQTTGNLASGFANKLPSNNLLLDGEAGNAHDQINDHITDFVLNIQSVLALYSKCLRGLWLAENVVGGYL